MKEPERCSTQILVADDDPQLRDLYRLALESQGYRVCLAADGQEALGHFRRSREHGQTFGVVILDLCMPQRDGLECAREILESDPQAQVIISTGDYALDLKDLVDRVATVLIKPVSLKSLLREVAACLHGAVRASA